MSKDTGGTAFPQIGTDFNNDNLEREICTTEKGMSLRDYFAAKAMQKCIGLCSTAERDAEEAYKIADAMLKARAK